MDLKIIVIGPKTSGKSQISNFLSQTSQSLFACPPNEFPYDPTAGVRIFELEVHRAQVQLWDSSGDNRFEGCWKAIMNNADGVIIVYNPDSPSHSQQLNDWLSFFVRNNGLKDDQCLVFAHRLNPTDQKVRAPSILSTVSVAVTGPNSDSDVKSRFETFVRELISMKQRK